MTRSLAAALLLLSAVIGTAAAQNLYKWVDAEGNVTYQDQPPPGADKEDVFAVDTADDDPGRALRAAHPVTLYAVPNCDACDFVRSVLDRYGVPFAEIDVVEDPEAQARLKELGQMAVPMLTVGNDVLPGASSLTIRHALARAGYATGVDGVPPGPPQAGADAGPEVRPDGSASPEDGESAPPEEVLGLDDLRIEPERIETIPEDERIQIGMPAE